MTSTPNDAYNYDTFRPGPYVEGGCDGPEQGAQLGAMTVWLSDGTPTSLAQFLDGVTVLEAGSTTCPAVPRQRPPDAQGGTEPPGRHVRRPVHA